MTKQRDLRLKALSSPAGQQALQGILHGIEKESLRVTPNGTLAQTPHPQSLGSALTHPQITTDYSEALLEFITPTFTDERDMLKRLEAIHHFTYSQLGNDEKLWVASMPCALIGSDDDIPVGQYGSTNSGKMKTVYRLGLGHRYGRAMQTIAGIHYNFSLPDDFWRLLETEEGDSNAELSEEKLQEIKTREYLGIIRNFRRYFWLLLYCFGASPVVCKSFVKSRQHQLTPFGSDDHSLHMPYATSLRMGDLGYQSNAQHCLVVCYNSLDKYIQTLKGAITQEHPSYQDIACQPENYQQLNTGLLQIENEFYSTIRPKRVAHSGETALTALKRGGIEYIEVRCIDLDPFEPLGISEQTSAFLDVFLLYCALEESPDAHNEEFRQIQENQKRVVERGRDPELTLLDAQNERNMQTWGAELLEAMLPIAEQLDSSRKTQHYRQSVEAQLAKLKDPSLTPSARILETMKEWDCSFFQLGQKLSSQAQEHFQKSESDHALTEQLREQASASLAEQADLESQKQEPFSEFLQQYFAQYDSLDSE